MFDSSDYKYACTFFEQSALDDAYFQPANSSKIVIAMKPSSFMRLTAWAKRQKATTSYTADYYGQGHKSKFLPQLNVVLNKDGNLEIGEKATDHEGKHRVSAIIKFCAQAIPVIINCKINKQGLQVIWRQTNVFPKYIIGNNMYAVPFPKPSIIAMTVRTQ